MQGKYFVHDLADNKSSAIGAETRIWQFCVIFPKAIIGRGCNICSHVLIENDVVIGDDVTVKSGVQIWDGVRLEDGVFIGPNVTFTNDILPRSKQYPEAFARTLVKRGASIGANSTIIAGNTIGRYALIGAGSVVTKTVGDYEVYYGNPAKLRGYITKTGELLDLQKRDKDGNYHSLEKS